MADLPPRSARSAIVLALGLVALLQLVPLLQGVQTVRRLQSRVTSQAEQRVWAVRPQLAAALAPGGPSAWAEAASVAVREGGAAEVDVLDARGAVVFSRPASAPVAHRLAPEQREKLTRTGALTVTVQEGERVRTLSYLPIAAEPGHLIRLSAPAGDLEDELREHQHSFTLQLVSLAILAAAALLVLRRERQPEAAGALQVYEQAMERLRNHGEEVEARHEAERRRMEELIREREAMARAGELTSGIVHEVRNGLGTIVGYARMLERAGLAGEARDAAGAIAAECETLEQVVRRFSDFIRKEQLALGPVDLSQLLRRVVCREQRAHERVETRLVGMEGPVPLSADEGLLERALENVVRNALQAAEAGGGLVAVEVRRSEGRLFITVEDDGPGLAADHPGDIRPFYSTRPGGLGLGLPLARKI
ncbi:MAG TPA: ATP-binding protein, partial [Vicinamibacteria bacterium]|nr:ATP-binding protein [Vicinamibacteria bacterium]